MVNVTMLRSLSFSLSSIIVVALSYSWRCLNFTRQMKSHKIALKKMSMTVYAHECFMSEKSAVRGNIFHLFIADGFIVCVMMREGGVMNSAASHESPPTASGMKSDEHFIHKRAFSVATFRISEAFQNWKSFSSLFLFFMTIIIIACWSCCLIQWRWALVRF